jgi:multiple sugar transport system permease protein
VLGLLFWGSARMPGRRLALTSLFTPMILPPAAVGTFFRLIYDPTIGVLTNYVSTLTNSPVTFLTDADTAFWATVAVDVWQWSPSMTLIALAALGSVPRAELEAAEVDRLPWLKRLWYIVRPHGKFILMLGILLQGRIAVRPYRTASIARIEHAGHDLATVALLLLSLQADRD